MIYPKSKRYNMQTITTEHFIFNCAGFSRGRNGFAHECYLFGPDGLQTEGVARWVNRTWESFKYQTAIDEAINKINDSALRELAQKEIKEHFNRESVLMNKELEQFKTDFNSLPDEQQARLRDSVGMVQSAEQFKTVCAITKFLAFFNDLNKEDSKDE